jgi:hypothetical protein
MGILYLIVYCVYILLFILAGMYFGPLPMCIVFSFFFASQFLSLSLLPINPDVFQWWSAFAPAPLCCTVYVAGDRSSPSFARLRAGLLESAQRGQLVLQVSTESAQRGQLVLQVSTASAQQDQLLLQVGASSVQLVHLVKKRATGPRTRSIFLSEAGGGGPSTDLPAKVCPPSETLT